MTYVLEKITPEDQQKIINDANPRLREYLCQAQRRGKFPTSWAIDRERNHYLFRGPMFFREDINYPYYVFAYGRMYLFRRNTPEDSFFFDEKEPSPPEELSRVQAEVELALPCHGSRGDHPRNMKISRVDFVPKPARFRQIY
jgi:hypothetical protein